MRIFFIHKVVLQTGSVHTLRFLRHAHRTKKELDIFGNYLVLVLSHSADYDSELPLFVAKRLIEVCQEIVNYN